MAITIPAIKAIEAKQLRQLPNFRVGDTIRVHYRIREGEKERTQIFQGTVIRKSRGGLGATFAVRKMSSGVGIERIFPIHSPRIEQIEVTASGHVRRSRLYYLRELQGKAARLRDTGRAATESLKPAAAAAAAED